jgi:hypothetical protein
MFCLVCVAQTQEVPVVEMEDFRHLDFDNESVEIKQDIQIKIEAVGLADRWEDNMLATGWIIDSDTRKVIWKLEVRNSSTYKSRYSRRAKEEIRLAKGTYEIYYAVSPRGFWDKSYRDFGDFLDDLFGGFRSSWRREARIWGIRILVDNQDKKYIEKTDILPDQGAIVHIAPLGDDEYENVGFSLSSDAEIRIYTIGEGTDGEMYDYGWIVNADTRERVWEMEYRRTQWAGGADKNRMVDKTIVLPEGNYVVYYVTDGSHSYDYWNQMAPFDPRFWGITLWGVSKGFRKDLTVKPYQPETEEKIIVEMTRVGDDRFLDESFVLKEPTQIRIRCLGEYPGRRFVDYGWILNTQTREIVWEMTRRNTRHAGGGSKNRIFDDVVSFESGNYEVYYKTDGSHSYRRWNVGPPYNPEAWGITLFGVGKDFNPETVSFYQRSTDPVLLAQIIRIGDHERVRERFTLEETTDIRIYALGEGDDDEMYDYGWIEDENGRRVWRMEYWDTEHAGGARKNRMINEVIILKPGGYTVYYKSDGSHSYEDWNADPPRDFMYWGITVKKEVD